MKVVLRAIVMMAVVSLSACGSDKASQSDGGPRGGAGGQAGAGGRGGSSGGAAGTAGGGSTGTGGVAGTGAAAGTGGASAGTGGAAAGTGGTTGRGGTGGTAGGGAGRGGSGGGRVACQTDGDCQLFKCCDGFCVNTRNDIANCGACNRPCGGPDPYCGNGTCGAPPCGTTTDCVAGALCCANACCTAGQLCCDNEIGPGVITRCVDPVNGSCPQGCIGGCPCTAPTTPIATPSGARPIADLRSGDLVYSLHRGALAVVAIKLVHRTPVAPTHRIVELRLAHGVVLQITPDHPTADGRTFGDLAAGDALDGVPVIAARTIAYGQAFTYDILPDSDSGTYVAGGVLIGSALAGPLTGQPVGVDPSRPGRRASLAR